MHAARRHDLHTILATADPDFRGCDMHGLEDLRRFFTRIEEPNPWKWFYESLSQGGVLSSDGTKFSSNYAVSLFPDQSVGRFGPEYFRVVRGANVPVYERTDTASRVVAHLSDDIVIPKNPIIEKGWQQIEFQKGQFGFLVSTHLIDPTGMSVRMQKRNGRWRLTGISTYCD